MTHRIARLLLIPALAVLATACQACGMGANPDGATRYAFTVVNEFPHDTSAFTQGLLYHDGHLYESTGVRGQSSLRKVALETGAVLQRRDLDAQFFGEGLTLFNGKLYQLTWTSRRGFIYDLESFDLLGEFSYETEGWGLTNDGERLIMSDGSHFLRFLDPESFEVLGQVPVFDGIQPISRLNELAYIDGQVFANVFRTDEIVIIDPATGALTGRIDLSALWERLPNSTRQNSEHVLNGIAHDDANGRLFVTGKRWPKLFEIELTPVSR